MTILAARRLGQSLMLPRMTLARGLQRITDPAESLKSEAETLAETEQDKRPDMPMDAPINPYQREKRKCVLCQYGIELDYKNTRLLSQFISPYTGKIYDKHITGLCDTQQKLLKHEIWRAYAAGFMSAFYKAPQFLADPKLFDSTKPGRPNPH